MSQETHVIAQCEECKNLNYDLEKSKQLRHKQRLNLKKFCKHCRKHTMHKETK